MSLGWNTKSGALTSCALDWVPFLGTVKGIYEGCYGKDVITSENLNVFQRAMCFLGAIPGVGSIFKKSFVKSEQALKNASKGAKAIKWADRAYGVYDAYDSATSNYDDKNLNKQQ